MSHSDLEEQAKKNRERYPLIYAAFVEASQMLQVFGEVKLLCGISIDGAAVGKQPHPGWFEQERAALESRQQTQL
jgi:hypothetical protein